MPVFQIQHLTQYRYDHPVRDSANQIKIYPARRPEQQILEHQLLVTPPTRVYTANDFWGNETGWFMAADPHDELQIESRLRIQTLPSAHGGPASSQPADWATVPGAMAADLRLLDLCQLTPMAALSDLRTVVASLSPGTDSPAAFAQRCSEYVFNTFLYQKGITTVETTLDELLELRSGVCQDFAHLLLQMLRLAGLPARYVSGYICPNRDGVRGAGATHAWVEVWLPQPGWLGLDPTNNCWVNDQHVVLSVGRQFADCSPVKGAYKGVAAQELSVVVSVGYEDGTRLEEQNWVQTSRDLPPTMLQQRAALAAEHQQQQ